MFKSVLNNYFWRVLQFFFKSIVPLFINFYGAKVLLPDEFGAVIYGLTFLSLINMLSNFGISSAVMKEAAELNSRGETDNIKKLFPSLAFISSIVVILIIIVVFVFVKNIPIYYYWSIPYLLFNPLTAILDGVYVGTNKFKKLSLATILSSIFFLPISYFFINTYREQGIILSYSLFYLLLFVFYYLAYPYKNGKYDKSIAMKVLKYSVVIGLGSVSFFLYSRVDIFILKEYGYIVAIGNYELIMRVFELTNIPIVLLAQVMAPNFINLLVKNDYYQIQKRAKILSTSIFAFGIVLSVAMYFVIPFLIKLYYPLYDTKEFMDIIKILLITVPLKFVGIFMTIAVLTPIGFAKLVSYTTLIFGVVNVILDFVFIDLYGFIGVFYATLLVHNINIIIQYTLFNFKFKKEMIQREEI